MLRRAIALFLLFAIAACQGDRTATGPEPGPTFAVSDGANGTGNEDFFFLPPLAADPTGHPEFSPGQFNAALAPRVRVCQLDTSYPSDPDDGTPCASGTTADVAPVVLVLDKEQYLAEWEAPSTSKVYYRFLVSVGGQDLGHADILIGHPARDLKSYPGEVPTGAPGRTVPVKFRIENRALCTPVEPRTAPCASTAVDLTTGGTVTITTDPTAPPSGVTIPPQPGGGTINVTVQPCTGGTLFDRGLVDIPVFGSCLTVSAEPLATPLANEALVYVCDVSLGTLNLNSEHQEHRVTLHRYDGATVRALPHAEACGGGSSSARHEFEGMVRHLARGEWTAAGGRLLALLGPRALQALDQGGGGLTDGFSDFQFGLPVKMEKHAGDDQAGVAGTPLPQDPTVKVTDLAGEPAAGARVRFAPDPGSGTIVPTDPVLTGTDGLASVAWTLPGDAGPVTLTAKGRGIGGDDNNGPRDGVDPFMPFPYAGPPAPESGGTASAVELMEGSLIFTAEALASQCSGATCGEGVVDLTEGGTVTVVTEEGQPPSGVFIPPQPEGAPRVLVTVEPCSDQDVIDDLVDIPVFGSCLTVATEPSITELAVPATVFVCDAEPGTAHLTHEQQERVTLHRYDGEQVYALEHAPACFTETAVATGSLVRRLARHLVRGQFRAAGSTFLRLVGPRTLHAIDQGGGGLSDMFSDFQFALPATMNIVAGNHQTGQPGNPLPVSPTVQVVDIGGDPVAGATVRFAGDGVAPFTEVVTLDDGEAALPVWTIPNAGANALTASGRGIAGDDPNNGPRPDEDDPFMAIPFLPNGESGPSGGMVPLEAGTRAFSATGDALVILPYSSRGFKYWVVTEGAKVGFEAEVLDANDESHFTTGDGPFATHPTITTPPTPPPAGCGIWTTYRPRTVLPDWLGTTAPNGGMDLLIRRTFWVPDVAAVEVRVAIDNDVQIWLNGLDISHGLRRHEGCAVRGDPFGIESVPVSYVTARARAGLNTIAVRARDRGVVGYFDIELRFGPLPVAY